jgi:heptosyltransferase-1
MKRVLLLRLGAIGDLVFASTLLPPLFQAEVKVDWLVDAALADFWTGHPALARVIPFPKKHFFHALKTGKWFSARTIWRKFYQRFFANLPPYDLAIDLHGLHKGSFLLKNLPAVEKISLGNQEKNFIWGQKIIPRGGDPADFASEYIFLAEALGLQPQIAQPWLTPSDYFLEFFFKNKQDIHSTAFLPTTKISLLLAKSPVVLAPFTTRAQKHWPLAYWRALIEALLKNNFSVSVLGAAADRAPAEAAFEGLAVQNLAGETTLSQALHCLSQAQAVIGVDTGWTHAALALQVPTLALFGSTRPYTRLPALGRGKILYLPVPCAPCGRKPICPGRRFQVYPCLQHLTPDLVFSAFLEVFL